MMNGLNSQRKSAHYLLAAYCLFIIYGCFIPFRFNLDPNFVRWRWEVFLLEPIQGQIPRPSLPDLASNILLFVPFGMLCTWARMAKGTPERALSQPSLTAIFGLLFGLAIESGQTMSPWRSPSLLDILCNGAGALIGALSGRVLFRAFERPVETNFLYALSGQPSLLVLGYLLLGVLMDSFYPFAVTLDIYAIWQNVKQSQFIPFQGGLHRYWLDLLVEKGAVFAAIGYLFYRNIRFRVSSINARSIWLMCSGVALSIETCKLFVAGRSFYSENVIISSCGALCAIFLYPRFAAPAWLKRRRHEVYLTIVVAFLVYFETSPFDWAPLNQLPARFSRIEWLPFKSYYSAEPLAALFDFQTKIYFLMPLGFVIMYLGTVQRAALPRRRALFVCLFIAIALESLQILIQSRIPSVTDVIIFSASAWVGIVLFEVFRKTKAETPRQTTETGGGSTVKAHTIDRA